MHKKCSVHNFLGVLFVLEGIFLFVHFEPTLKVHMKYGKRYRNKRLTFVPILMRLLYLPFVPVFIRTLQLGSTVPTDHPDRLGPPDPAERASQKTPPGETRTRPDAAAGAARCLEVATRGRGASKRLVSVRPAAAGASLAHRGLTSTRVAPGTLASSPQVCTRTLPAKKRATQVHREPYDASSARGGWCLRSPLGAAVHRERRCIWLGAWRVAQVAAKLLDHRRSGALDLRPPEPTGALPPEHTPLSAWPHITARSSVTRDGAQYLRLFTW